MRARTEAAVAIEESAAQAVDSAIAQAHLRHRLRSLDVDLPGPELRPPRRRGRRHVVRRAAPRRGRARRPGRGRLAGRGVDAVLPGHRERPDGAGPAAPVPDDRPRGRRPVRRGVRRSGQRARGAARRHPRSAARRARTRRASGSMRDIVATIQAEQDVVIRAPLDACLIVQGGPGTGKTAVGPAPRRVPALRAPLAARRSRRARPRAEPGVPALHRAGAAVAR